jgi:hypothetical protein
LVIRRAINRRISAVDAAPMVMKMDVYTSNWSPAMVVVVLPDGPHEVR